MEAAGHQCPPCPAWCPLPPRHVGAHGEPAPADFGKKLLDWAREKGIRLVVIAADETGASRWAGSAGNAVVRLRSPDARELAAASSARRAPGNCGPRSSTAPRSRHLESAPKAEDARRLARLIIEGTDRSPEEIADEYQGWREWIDKTLPREEVRHADPHVGGGIL